MKKHIYTANYSIMVPYHLLLESRGIEGERERERRERER